MNFARAIAWNEVFTAQATRLTVSDDRSTSPFEASSSNLWVSSFASRNATTSSSGTLTSRAPR